MATPPRGGQQDQQGPTGTAIVVATLLALSGFALGLVLGGGDGDPETVTVADVQTVTVGTTKTVRKTVTRTVTEPAEDDLALDETTADTTSTAEDENCSLDYLDACVPEDASDVSCADLDERRFESIGDDPYGLDPDGDGIACE
ncbi:MAG TPA: hypothetical protein VD931_19570 [Baekduia sp.]|nr:hypothetical protein [Baekduia sp.]